MIELKKLSKRIINLITLIVKLQLTNGKYECEYLIMHYFDYLIILLCIVLC